MDIRPYALQTLRQWVGTLWRSPTTREERVRPGVELLTVDLDNSEFLAEQSLLFQTARQTADYQAVYRLVEPQVTVCITTADRADVLRERALASMLRQTYRRIEVIIVGDCCEDNTEQLVASLNDKRFTFVNLPERGPYPAPGNHRWLVAGTYPGNEALRRACGDFVTHIDEDDTFSDDRIAVLVAAIQAAQADVVYHPFWWENEDKSWTMRGDGRFEHAQTGTSMVLYHRWLARIPWDVNAFRHGEPGDWNRFRKFAALGVHTHFVSEPLTWHWKYPLRDPFTPKPGERFLDGPSEA
jgi:hypothetical protein